MVKILYSVDNGVVYGEYKEDSVIPYGCAVAEVDHFVGGGYQFWRYNSETGELSVIEGTLEKHIKFSKGLKKRQLEQHIRMVEKAPVEVDGVLWDADPASLQKITLWLSRLNATAALPENFTWRNHLNVEVPIANNIELEALLTSILTAALDRDSKLRKVLWQEKNKVDALQSLEEIDAYKPESTLFPL